LSGLPEGKVISYAKLWLFCYITIGDNNIEVRYSPTDSWSESTITWNNAPWFGDVLSTVSIPQSTGWYSWEVTSAVQIGYSGDKILSLVMKRDNEIPQKLSYLDGFYSKEYSSAATPYLEVTCSSDLPHGLIDTDEIFGEKTRLCAELFHDGLESDPDYDYFAVRVTVADPYIVVPTHHPLYVKVRLEMQDFCEEFPDNHQPQAGSYGSHPISLGFSYYGIGLSVTAPAYYIDYFRGYQNGKLIVEWNIRPSTILGIAAGWVFIDYTSYAIGVRVPEGYKPYVIAYTEVDYYKRMSLWPIYYDQLVDKVGWGAVDPPGANPITPETPDPLNSPTEVYTARVNQVQITDRKGQAKTSFQRGETIYIYPNWDWGPDDTMTLVINLYDTTDTWIGFAAATWSRLSPGNWRCGFGFFISYRANPGPVTIRANIYTYPPWWGGKEYAPETTIPIEILNEEFDDPWY